MQHKKFSFDLYLVGMLALVAVATLLRFILIAFNWPPTHSDESVMDLMAVHIAYRGEHPTFYYGQYYMAPIEAYIGAPLFKLFGISLFTLRLGLLPFFALFLVSMYYLTSLVYTKGLALFTVALLTVGSSDMLTHQLLAIGGYPEILLFASLIFLLAVGLSLSAKPGRHDYTASERWRRLLLYTFLGFVIGFSLWDDQLILPCIATAGLLLLVFNWRELLGWPIPGMILGFVLGALPLILYNLKPVPGQNSLDVLLYFHNLGAKEVATAHITFWQKLVGVVVFSLPITTGVNPCNRVEDLPLFGPTHPHATSCNAIQLGWSLGLMLFWTIAVALALYALWRSIRRSRTASAAQRQESSQTESVQDVHNTGSGMTERQTQIRNFARLMLLLSAAMFFVMFLCSNIAALFPVSSARYLIGFLLIIPALLWPLWSGLGTLKPPFTLATQLSLLVRIGVLTLIGTTFLLGTVRTFQDIPKAQAAFSSQDDLVHNLLHIGATRLYTDYWTCNRIIFASNEKILCAVILRHDRYKPYLDAVQATPHPAYLFPNGSSGAAYFAQQHAHDHLYQHYVFDGYDVFQYKAGQGSTKIQIHST